jgi:isoleucyl-tRNA synthetase
MSCITPFITEHMYQNLRNGISEKTDPQLAQESIHFLQIPDVDESMIDEAIEKRIQRMQSAIENGRIIRERKVIPVKTPLAKVVLVDADHEALKDLEEVKSYILEELNCLELVTDNDEDKYIDYKCDPDNREMGSVLKKKFDKKLKEQISNLSSDQLRSYLKDGHLMLGDIKIEHGWLKVDKIFNQSYQENPDFGCASNLTTAALLQTKLDHNLKLLGQSREITNKIQRLRKSCGVSIEDQIEVFYEIQGDGNPMVNEALDTHADKIKKAIKSPFMQKSMMQPRQVVIAETSEEDLAICICKPAVQLDEKQLPEGVSAEVVRAYLNSFNPASLSELLQKNNGVLQFNLDNKPVKLTHKVHFFIDARDRD